MRLAASAWRLPGRQKALAFEALLWLTACRVALFVSSYSRASASLSWFAALATRREASRDECRISVLRAVRISGEPGCLARAMAAQAMLRRSGYAASVTFGVQRDTGINIAAHAWIECEGLIVSGGSEAERYVALSRAEPL